MLMATLDPCMYIVVRSSKKKFTSQSSYKRQNNPPYLPKRHEILSGKEYKTSYYGCGKPGFIKKKCPNCSPRNKKNYRNTKRFYFVVKTSIVSAPNIAITIFNNEVPFSSLTKKTFGIGEKQNKKLFGTQKNCLITHLFKPFILRTDASNYAFGAVLLHGDNKYPIKYVSRHLTFSERNYSTSQRKVLVVVWEFEKFRCKESREIKIVTGHQQLKWLMNFKSQSGRLARWSLKIQSCNLKIVYIPRKSNIVADILLRPICDTEVNNSENYNFVRVHMTTRSCSGISEAQMRDENLQKIICLGNNQ
ncbi:retrovirus-related Pol polyprotein from transposon 297 [Caerostris darwini]|uniref:Retrovirus-related Pol polyprotein from transposon 297 n=1 Tax=Caerostris darwini TaxID=1538125 RepID=A0AAV4SLT1_9ARAC|nr:retrovirus-related Pol polyprotein from transposon 297 [Caerostris darwini]